MVQERGRDGLGISFAQGRRREKVEAGNPANISGRGDAGAGAGAGYEEKDEARIGVTLIHGDAVSARPGGRPAQLPMPARCVWSLSWRRRSAKSDLLRRPYDTV